MRLLCGKDCLKAKHIKTQNKTNQKAEVHRGTEVPRGSERYTRNSWLSSTLPSLTQRYSGVQSTQKYQGVHRGTVRYREVQRDTQKYQGVHRVTKKYPEVLKGTKKYQGYTKGTQGYTKVPKGKRLFPKQEPIYRQREILDYRDLGEYQR